MIARVFNPITWVLSTLCILWIPLAEIGGFSLQLPYLALSAVILFAATGPAKIALLIGYLRSNLVWIAPYAVYLVILAAVLHGSLGQNIAPRQIFYLISGIALAASLAVARQPGKLLRTGAMLGLLTLVVTIEILARRLGLSWWDAIRAFATSGNLEYVTYTFFRAIFNSLDPSGDAGISSSRKNDIAAGVLVLGLLFRVGATDSRRDLIGVLFLGFALGLMLLLNTRSVLIAAGASLTLTTLIGSVIRPVSSNFWLVAKLAGALALMVLAAQSSLSDAAVSGTLSDRFSFGDDSAASRVDQLRTALERIELHPVAGSGYHEVEGNPIHNLFLGAWMHAGLFAFLLVVLFYVALLARWLVYVARISRMPELWVLPIAFEWLAPLLVMPLFRVWLSGDAGHPYLSEWLSISIFFGCCLANERMRGRLARLSDPAAGITGLPTHRWRNAMIRS